MADLKNLCREELKYRIEICKNSNKNDIILLQKILYNMNDYVIKGKNSSFADEQKQKIQELNNKSEEISFALKNAIQYRETKLSELHNFPKERDNIKIIIDMNNIKISQLITMLQENDATLKEKTKSYKEVVNQRIYEIDKEFLLIQCRHCKGNEKHGICPVCCGIYVYKIYKIINKHKPVKNVKFNI